MKPFQRKPIKVDRPGPRPGSVLTVAECKDHMQTLGWVFQHRNVFGDYVFRNENCTSTPELAFTMTELRNAVKYGF